MIIFVTQSSDIINVTISLHKQGSPAIPLPLCRQQRKKIGKETGTSGNRTANSQGTKIAKIIVDSEVSQQAQTKPRKEERETERRTRLKGRPVSSVRPVMTLIPAISS